MVIQENWKESLSVILEGDKMKISNWESAKKKAIVRLPAFTITVTIIFFIASFITFWNGHIDYQEQIKQLDWAETDATVSFVYEYFDAFHTQHGRGRTLYDIHYEYYADDQIYTGIIEGQHTPKKEGDTFTIKYNPQNPEENTRALEPSKSYLVSGSIFGVLGLVMVILTVVLVKKGRDL